MKAKIARIAAAVSMLATALLSNGPALHAQQFASYTSGVQIANLEATDAQVTLTAYNPDGSQNGSPLVDTVTANGSKTFFPISNVSNGFSGSIVVSSSKKVAAIANILSSDFKAGGSYIGSSAGATTVLLPLLMQGNNGFNTWYSVQNAGSGDANVSVSYSDGTTATATIKQGAAKVFYQAKETHSQKVFAGTITSNQPVVAAVLQEDPKTMFANNGFNGGSTNPVFPLINANNAGIITGVQIQNAGTQPTTVEVSYTPSLAGTACKETQTIQPKASATFTLFAFSSGKDSTCAAGSKFVGSAKVTANSASQPLVGIGNQLKPGVNGGAYNSFNVNDATSKVVLPLIMDRNSGFFTGFSVQNVGTSATTVNCTFTNSTYTVSKLLQPDEALADLQSGKIADKYVGGATCTADSTSAKIIAVVNQLGPNGAADQLFVYEGAPS